MRCDQHAVPCASLVSCDITFSNSEQCEGSCFIASYQITMRLSFLVGGDHPTKSTSTFELYYCRFQHCILWSGYWRNLFNGHFLFMAMLHCIKWPCEWFACKFIFLADWIYPPDQLPISPARTRARLEAPLVAVPLVHSFTLKVPRQDKPLQIEWQPDLSRLSSCIVQISMAVVQIGLHWTANDQPLKQVSDEGDIF